MNGRGNTYLVGAVSGIALIVVAVIAFVALVSGQALHEWPISGLGGAGSGAGTATTKASQAVPRLNPPSVGRASVAAARDAGTAIDAARTPGKPGHAGGAADGGTTGSLADGAPAISPAIAETVARNPSTRPPEGVGSAPPAPSAESIAAVESTGAGSGSSPAATGGRKGSDELAAAASPSPASTETVAPGPSTHPPADSAPPALSVESPESDHESGFAVEGETGRCEHGEDAIGSASPAPEDPGLGMGEFRDDADTRATSPPLPAH